MDGQFVNKGFKAWIWCFCVLNLIPYNMEFYKKYMYDRWVFNLAAFWHLPVQQIHVD